MFGFIQFVEFVVKISRDAGMGAGEGCDINTRKSQIVRFSPVTSWVSQLASGDPTVITRDSCIIFSEFSPNTFSSHNNIIMPKGRGSPEWQRANPLLEQDYDAVDGIVDMTPDQVKSTAK